MCKRGDLIDTIPVSNGLAVAVYHDRDSGQWSALARIPTPIGNVEVTATVREDVVTAALLAARQLWCKLMGISNCDPTDVFLSNHDDSTNQQTNVAGTARAKVAQTVVRVARAASLLHRARMGDPSACAGVATIVRAAKAGDPTAGSSWKILQTIAGLAQVARGFAPHEVDGAQYDAMVQGYRSQPALDMVAGADGSYRLRRRKDGSAASWAPQAQRFGAGSIVAGGGRYGLAMRW
jgi:hypothetical protein